jgi:hypothetical protein
MPTVDPVAVGFACSVFLVASVYCGFPPPQLSRDFSLLFFIAAPTLLVFVFAWIPSTSPFLNAMQINFVGSSQM